MARRSFGLLRDGEPFLSIFSGARQGPRRQTHLTHSEIEQIRRTVRRAPEVMVKVTGGGRKVSAVLAHLSYIGGNGEHPIETDEGERIPERGARELVKDWHLELTAGHYRKPTNDGARSGVKLVHNIVLSMPSPTPADKVLAATKVFAREKFGAKHRYAMALHTHQDHPHVHLVVKAEGHDGRRLHIDKAMLREWRQDFAQLMRDQGVAANATPRVARGRAKRVERDGAYRARRNGRSQALRTQVESIARELKDGRLRPDPAHRRLVETRKAVVAGWMELATALDAQGEIVLAGDVRYFASHLPPVLTDREQLAQAFLQHVSAERSAKLNPVRERTPERTR
jgi:hypothetical protein